MTLVLPDPTTEPEPEPVTPRSARTNTQRDHHHRSGRSADRSSHSPPSLTAFASVGASPEAEWADDVPGAESEDDVATDASDSEDEAEWAAAAAAELADEAKWEDAAPAESEDDARGEADTAEPDTPLPLLSSESALKAEIFRWLEAVSEARRLQEARLNRPPPPARAVDPDEPIWPPKSRHWRRFCELSATKSSPANPVVTPDENSLSLPPSNKNKEMLSDNVADQGELSAMKSCPANTVVTPDENSLSLPPSNKNKEMLSDKVVDQVSNTKQASKSASCQIVPYNYKNGHEEKPLIVPPKKIKYSIDTYAVQCGKCLKWRLIPTKIKYDEIREKTRHVPFLCEHVHEWKPGVSCDDPADISQDHGFWVIDRHCISQTPLGWERTISIRCEGSSTFADVYYFSPTGKRLRSKPDVENYLQDNPDCAVGLHESQFSFTIPERLQDYRKRCRLRESKRHRQPKRRRRSKPIEPNEVLPLSCAPPVHEDLPLSCAPPVHEDLVPNCVLALYDEGQYCM